jgi:hypothetical protein
MERKGNEKDDIVKVIMPKTPYSRQKIQAGHLKLRHFVIRFSSCTQSVVYKHYTLNAKY